jgi:hypothetical protein
VNPPCGEERLPYAFANISVRKLSPVFIIAQRIRASLLASATVTSRAGFFASSLTIQSRKAPLRLPTTFSSEVAPNTSSFLMYRFPCLDGPERLLAAARVLPRREAEPGGEIASRLEHARVRHAGCDHRSAKFEVLMQLEKDLPVRQRRIH